MKNKYYHSQPVPAGVPAEFARRTHAPSPVLTRQSLRVIVAQMVD